MLWSKVPFLIVIIGTILVYDHMTYVLLNLGSILSYVSVKLDLGRVLNIDYLMHPCIYLHQLVFLCMLIRIIEKVL